MLTSRVVLAPCASARSPLWVAAGTSSARTNPASGSTTTPTGSRTPRFSNYWRRSDLMPLRDYQSGAISAIVEEDQQGCMNQLIALPTGTGKTVIASHLPEAIELLPWEVMVFLVGAEELAFQAVDSLREANPSL